GCEKGPSPKARPLVEIDTPPSAATRSESSGLNALRALSPADSLDDLGHRSGADRAATLADGEAEALLHGDGLDQLNRHVGGVAGHDHLGALGQGDDAGDVGGTEA